MIARVVTVVLLGVLMAAPAGAQSQPTRLATLFEDIFGPNGLVLSSDDVQLDGTNHAAHFNSAFQSEFRLVNIALTSQLAAIPLPSPGSGFTYKFDDASGTFVRSTRSFGPILAERGETIGRGRLAVNFAYQFFSFDHLDGVPLVAVPAVFRHDNAAARRRPRRRRVDHEQHGGVGQPVQRRGDLRRHGPARRLARDAGRAHEPVATLERDHSSCRHRNRPLRALLCGSRGDWRLRFVAAILRRRVGERPWRSGGARQGDAAARGDARARGWRRCPSANRRRAESARGRRRGLRPFAAFSASVGAFAPHANVAYQWNGKSVLAGDVYADVKGDLPDQFMYALGSDLSVNRALQSRFRPPRPTRHRLATPAGLDVHRHRRRRQRDAARHSVHADVGTGRRSPPSASRPTWPRASCSISTCASASARTASSTASPP